MKLPKHVLMNSDVHGQCCMFNGRFWPFIRVLRDSKCNFKIETNRTVGTSVLHCVNFVIKKVAATCQYLCVYSQYRIIKTVVVTGTYVYNMYVCPYCIAVEFFYRCKDITNTFKYNYI